MNIAINDVVSIHGGPHWGLDGRVIEFGPMCLLETRVGAIHVPVRSLQRHDDQTLDCSPLDPRLPTSLCEYENGSQILSDHIGKRWIRHPTGEVERLPKGYSEQRAWFRSRTPLGDRITGQAFQHRIGTREIAASVLAAWGGLSQASF